MDTVIHVAEEAPEPVAPAPVAPAPVAPPAAAKPVVRVDIPDNDDDFARASEDGTPPAAAEPVVIIDIPDDDDILPASEDAPPASASASAADELAIVVHDAHPVRRRVELAIVVHNAHPVRRRIVKPASVDEDAAKKKPASAPSLAALVALVGYNAALMAGIVPEVDRVAVDSAKGATAIISVLFIITVSTKFGAWGCIAAVPAAVVATTIMTGLWKKFWH